MAKKRQKIHPRIRIETAEMLPDKSISYAWETEYQDGHKKFAQGLVRRDFPLYRWARERYNMVNPGDWYKLTCVWQDQRWVGLPPDEDTEDVKPWLDRKMGFVTIR
jgi:hypothetical protein